ncbi:carboxypeptidase-like regulatory domain-containing protein [Flavobacterium gilvum]|uniref:Uncharacterized protein n=1 Tax=Flavobacterium gilvum TaxID=1492737 RepID=A0AAC9I169_9FLAO|nr:carboxypeptidase-like regulatory domain-containing protein [Flavobacterium gilvum]AOW08409.1 hypothetical protein EM308_02195 [Flavobacterium gilvum]KFC58335.1 hypothetical protein FEM08_28930 [Flavobacterium gilvum]
MKVKLLPVFFLLTSQFSISQTEKAVKGKVTCENILLQNVNVINKTSKKSTLTDENGEFVIDVKANDSLVFYAKDYHLKKIKLSLAQIEQNNLEIIIFKKPEELNEVIVTTLPSIKWKEDEKWKQEMRDRVKLDKAANSPKTGVYDGAIVNGMDFVAIGKMIVDLFAKEKEKKKETVPKIEFAVLAKSICDENFYFKTLKLKPEEIDLFLQFCDTDPKSKKLISNHNKLSMMDFLMAKNIEFQKQKRL